VIDLKGKVAVVTGSSRGIGRAIVESYSRAGARVVVSSRLPDTCEPVAAALRARGGDAIAIPCHIGRKDELQALTDKTLSHYGAIDVLVCNAAVNPVYGPTASVSDSAFDKIMQTNVRSAFWLCNMVIPGMAARRSGSVILMSSIAGLRASTTIGCYGISKAAQAAMARNLAVEYGPSNVRVNAIAPGLIETDFAKALIDDPVRREHIEKSTPLRRIGQPAEIAGVALFLASDLSSYITGQVIVADGGEMAA
jgi:dehydrogenase/reductase SDR family member 4